jgi:hypothetical protein
MAISQEKRERRIVGVANPVHRQQDILDDVVTSTLSAICLRTSTRIWDNSPQQLRVNFAIPRLSRGH